MKVEPHELHSLRELIIYARSFAQMLPDNGGDTFAARLQAHAQIIEDMLERVEPCKN